MIMRRRRRITRARPHGCSTVAEILGWWAEQNQKADMDKGGLRTVRKAPAKGSKKGCMKGKGGPDNGSCNYRGVRQRTWGKWVSEVREPNRGERLWLGTFDSAKEAGLAYDEAARILYGCNARLNFPEITDSNVLSLPSTCFGEVADSPIPKCETSSPAVSEPATSCITSGKDEEVDNFAPTDPISKSEFTQSVGRIREVKEEMDEIERFTAPFVAQRMDQGATTSGLSRNVKSEVDDMFIQQQNSSIFSLDIETFPSLSYASLGDLQDSDFFDPEEMLELLDEDCRVNDVQPPSIRDSLWESIAGTSPSREDGSLNRETGASYFSTSDEVTDREVFSDAEEMLELLDDDCRVNDVQPPSIRDSLWESIAGTLPSREDGSLNRETGASYFSTSDEVTDREVFSDVDLEPSSLGASLAAANGVNDFGTEEIIFDTFREQAPRFDRKTSQGLYPGSFASHEIGRFLSLPELQPALYRASG